MSYITDNHLIIKTLAVVRLSSICLNLQLWYKHEHYLKNKSKQFYRLLQQYS